LTLDPHTLLDDAQAQAATLSRELAHAIQDAIDHQTQYYGLRDGWRRARNHFAPAFEAALVELLQAARRGEDPLQRHVGGLDSLSLVDEQQALQDVAVAHVIHATEDLSKPEIYQIGNFFAALRGTARARDRDNPLRPALYAHALQRALSAGELAVQARYELMRVAAMPLAQSLHHLYSTACAQLRAAELSDMVSSFGGSRAEHCAYQRLAAARGLISSGQGTFDGLARRVDRINSRPQGLDPVINRGPAAPQPFVRALGPDMLSRLYDQILADPRLLPPIKAMLARLQVAVVRLSRADPSLLRRQDHPTWALLNRVAAHGMAFERADDERLQAFVKFMEAELQFLVDTPMPNATLFHQVLGRVEAHIDNQVRASSASSAPALEALERQQMRAQWLGLVREQIEHQIEAAPLGPAMLNFLQTHWAHVIVEAMVRHGRDSRESHAAMDTIDALLDSLHLPGDMAAREGLRMRLPALIGRLRAGCDSIQMSESVRNAALGELMEQHSRLLRGLPALERPRVSPRAAPKAPPVAATPPTAEDIVQRLKEERDSQVPSHWLSAEVDRGELPTVPLPLLGGKDGSAAREVLQNWVDGVQLGHWYHLFIQGDWLTAQIAWVSESRQYLLFVGRDTTERHSITRGALEALRANGLITDLVEDSVVQRAVDTLMNDLDETG
jgi:hypothetical protein